MCGADMFRVSLGLLLLVRDRGKLEWGPWTSWQVCSFGRGYGGASMRQPLVRSLMPPLTKR